MHASRVAVVLGTGVILAACGTTPNPAVRAPQANPLAAKAAHLPGAPAARGVITLDVFGDGHAGPNFSTWEMSTLKLTFKASAAVDTIKWSVDGGVWPVLDNEKTFLFKPMGWGESRVTLTVSNKAGDTGSKSFRVNVYPVNPIPTPFPVPPVPPIPHQ